MAKCSSMCIELNISLQKHLTLAKIGPKWLSEVIILAGSRWELKNLEFLQGDNSQGKEEQYSMNNVVDDTNVSRMKRIKDKK